RHSARDEVFPDNYSRPITLRETRYTPTSRRFTLKHIGALVGFTVLVFGTLFIFTHDWSTPTEEDVAVAEAPAPEAAPVEAAEPISVDEALLAAGQGQYAMCQGCHGPAGEGSMGPAFVANEHLADAGFV